MRNNSLYPVQTYLMNSHKTSSRRFPTSCSKYESDRSAIWSPFIVSKAFADRDDATHMDLALYYVKVPVLAASLSSVSQFKRTVPCGSTYWSWRPVPPRYAYQPPRSSAHLSHPRPNTRWNDRNLFGKPAQHTWSHQLVTWPQLDFRHGPRRNPLPGPT